MQFTDMLMTIISFYDIENLRFSVEVEPGIMFGQTREVELEIDEKEKIITTFPMQPAERKYPKIYFLLS